MDIGSPMLQNHGEVAERLRESLGLSDPLLRVRELERLYNDCQKSLKELDVEFILKDIPQDRKEWKALFQIFSDHVGRCMARSKLIGVATTVIKELREVKRKEKLEIQSRIIDAQKIRGMKNPADIKHAMRELSSVAGLEVQEPVGVAETSLSITP